jgi:coenzyme F420-reducing hydrogenase alpha subunit
MNNRTVKVDYLARVEGEGALYLKTSKGKVLDAKLRIFEPPRFFEAFLRGRHFAEAPDITARICGICPVAYQMSAVHAMENALGVTVGGQLRAVRRLLYCGEWIESHVLHVYLLHAPDFLGHQDAIRMAKEHPEVVKRGLRMKKLGNAIVTLVGGREIHPINVKVGGFYKLPTRQELLALVPELTWTRDAAYETIALAASLTFPAFDQDYEFVALRSDDALAEYPFNEGRLVSSKGLDIPVASYDQHFVEEHVEHSNALHSVHKERGAYFVGPLARFNLNRDRLPSGVAKAAKAAGLAGTVTNPFKSIIVRAVETLYACEEALRIIAEYDPPAVASVPVTPRAGTGYSCTEAPRGILYHRYMLDAKGIILDAKIVPPTSQNQRTIESDLRHFAAAHLHLNDADLTWQCEQAVRNYDPCISCATHFLTLTREEA